MSYSWVDPAFVALYRRREEIARLERLERRLRARDRHRDLLHGTYWREAGWIEQDALQARPPRYL